MCRYFIPCNMCGLPVLVDQPDSSNIHITEAVCEECLQMLKTDDTRVIGKAKQMKQLLSENGLPPYPGALEITKVLK